MKMTMIVAGALILAGLGLGIHGRHADSKAPAIGSPAPDFTLNSQDSKPVSLPDFKGK
jgi:cytochrome oxidase Cu insertion factor (SCO1/SenC/PrrC family)